MQGRQPAEEIGDGSDFCETDGKLTPFPLLLGWACARARIPLLALRAWMERDFNARDGLTQCGTPVHFPAMQTVYVETSVISHAAARVSRAPRIAVLQEEARRWWAECRPHYRVVTSQFVIDDQKKVPATKSGQDGSFSNFGGWHLFAYTRHSPRRIQPWLQGSECRQRRAWMGNWRNPSHSPPNQVSSGIRCNARS